MNIFREVADVQTADMLDLEVPKLRDGKYFIVESEPYWYVKQVMEDFVVRAERIRNGGIDPSEDNFLKITHEARLLGTDARLLELDAPNNPEGKLNKVVENVVYEYNKATEERKIGCQLIFFDSAPGGRTFQRVEVPNPPGSGKDIANGKGVVGDCESEGSRMANLWSDEQKSYQAINVGKAAIQVEAQ